MCEIEEQQIIERFMNIVSGANNRIVSTRLNERYFINHNVKHIWDEFNRLTSGLNCEIGDRLIFVREGYIKERPKCIVCGNPVTISDRCVSKYCCKQCATKDPNRSKKISATKQHQDHTKANEKRKQTMLDKYGVVSNSQRNDIHHRWTKHKVSDDVHALLSDRQWVYDQYVVQNKTSTQIAKEIGCDFSTVLAYCRKHEIEITHGYQYSEIEVDVRRYLDSLSVSYDTNYVGLYDDKREVDIFIASNNVAIEINGLRWHCELYKDRLYHKRKCDQLDPNIRLIQITDYQWIRKQEICKSIIRSALGLNQRIYARKCQIEVHSEATTEIRSLFEQNHIDGFVGGNLYVVARHNGQLVCGAIFGFARFDNQKVHELIRFVTKIGLTCVGGFSKIIKTYRRLRPNTQLISYVNKSLFDGKMYTSTDQWERLPDTDVGYFWTNGNEIISRFKAMKKNMAVWNAQYDQSLTEAGNMHQLKYYRYFDAGNQRYMLKHI